MESLEEVLQKGGTERVLFTINGQAYTGEMFKRFASSHPQAVKRQLNGFIAKSLLDYESQHMERKHPELRYTLQEYAEKCLAEEIVHQKVDLPAVNDRAGLATYFKFHSSDYRWEHPRYKGVVLHCADKKTAKQAKKLLKKFRRMNGRICFAKYLIHPVLKQLKLNRVFLPTEIINI